MIWMSFVVNRIGKAAHFIGLNAFLLISNRKLKSWSAVTKPKSDDFFYAVPLEIVYNIGGGIILGLTIILLEKYIR